MKIVRKKKENLEEALILGCSLLSIYHELKKISRIKRILSLRVMINEWKASRQIPATN